MSIPIADCVQYIEQLYSDVLNKMPISKFMLSFKLIKQSKLKETIQSYIVILQNNTTKNDIKVRQSEITMLNEVINHYDRLENSFNTQLQKDKKKNTAEKVTFSKFCNTLAENPEIVPNFDYPLAYNKICPNIPIPYATGGKLTVKQLKAAAKTRKIKKYSSMRKSELIKALNK